ncbi:MAG: hypothetical protein AABO41_22630 [Acidobacteriota bacterium]
MKSAIRIIPIMALVIWVSAASFPVEAQKQRSKEGTGPTNPTPTQDIKSSGKDPKRKTIGDCDSVKGCKALKSACESKQVGGTFNPSKPDGSAGTCVKEATKAMGTIAAATKDARDANCYSFALCQALKTRCQGTWKQPYPNTGIGKCVD